MASQGCAGCREGKAFDMPISVAFQPIVDAGTRQVFAFEALVRGAAGEPAATVLGAVTEQNRYGFDQACRVTALEWAGRLGVASEGAALSINFLPNAVYEPRACIRATLAAAERVGFPLRSIIFEITENEQVTDPAHLQRIIRAYREIGFRTAIDDFGAGHANLNLLAAFQPDIVKLDMALVRNIDADPVRRALVRGIAGMTRELGITLIAEGIETEGEHQALCDLGITLQQGYLFARPGFQQLPVPVWPGLPALATANDAVMARA